MAGVEKLPIDPRYVRDDGLMVVSVERELPFAAKDKAAVWLPPLTIGGNHRHPRSEAFICFGSDIEIVWLEGEERRRESIQPDNGQPYLIIVHSQVPHAVRNNSRTEPAFLLEYGSAMQRPEDVTRVVLLEKETS